MMKVLLQQDQGEFIIAKHRNGGLDNIRLKFLVI